MVFTYCQERIFVILNTALLTVAVNFFDTITMTAISRFFRSDLTQGIMHLLFPEKCIFCELELVPSENQLCTSCASNLPETHYDLSDEPTEMDRIFWGRTTVNGTYAHLFFKKQKSSQSVLFSLKYKNATTIGHYFGKRIGERIRHRSTFSTIDAIIPVPLHPKKEFIRGYNQSKFIADGIAETFGKPVNSHLVQRVKHNETQTKKNRFQRWDNVQGLFYVHPAIKNHNHVLIVDDVITTGSTIEAIIASMRAVHPSLNVSVVTLAIA